MNPSRYNLIFPYKGKYVLFNTATGSILLIDGQMKEALEKNNLSLLDEERRTTLKATGVITDDTDERKTVRARYERSKHDNSRAHVSVITTYQCNLSCVYCYQGKGEVERKRMDTKTALSLIPFVKATASPAATLGVMLFGGEPLLNMPVNVLLARELRAWCEETGKAFALSAVTNGTLLTPENVEVLSEYNCSIMTVLDGPKDIHDSRKRYKHGGGTFDDIVRGLERVRDRHLKTILRINVDETNERHVLPLLEVVKETLGGVTLSIKPVFSSPACTSYRYCVPAEREMEIEDDLYRRARGMGFPVEQPEKPSPLGACAAETDACFTIDPYLRLFRCVILAPFEENAVGTLREGDARPALNTLYSDFSSRDPFTLSACRDCELVPVCRGGCPAEALKKEGTTHASVCKKKGIYARLEKMLVSLAQNRSG